MNSGTITRWLICRICLKNNNKELYTIYGEDDEDGRSHELEDLKDKIELNGGIILPVQNNLPNKICSRCLLLLRASCKFRDLCEQSQRQLKQFIRPNKPQQDDEELENLVTNGENEPDNDNDDECIYTNSNVNSLEDDYVTDDPKPSASNALTEQYSIEFNNDEEEANDMNTHDDPADHHMAEEDEGEGDYVFEHATESSQDTQDQLITDDTTDPYAIDHSIHIQYYDVPDDIDDVKYMTVNEPSDLNEEIDNAMHKAVKRKRRTLKEVTKSEGTFYKCQYCDNVYQDKAKYAMHIKMHRKVKPHECEICGKRFSTTPQLSRHMNSHTGNRPYKCQYCEACFGDPSTKIKHERIHTNERPYKCPLCPKSFSYSNVLKVHMMVHTGEKPHTCSFCDKSFSQLHHKNAHEKRHRNLIVMGSDDNDVDVDDDFKDFEIEKQ